MIPLILEKVTFFSVTKFKIDKYLVNISSKNLFINVSAFIIGRLWF